MKTGKFAAPKIEPWLDVRGRFYACEDAERMGQLELYIRMQKRIQQEERDGGTISAQTARSIRCAFCRAGVPALPAGVVLSRSNRESEQSGADA